jgi:hypothetical protein
MMAEYRQRSIALQASSRGAPDIGTRLRRVAAT